MQTSIHYIIIEENTIACASRLAADNTTAKILQTFYFETTADVDPHRLSLEDRGRYHDAKLCRGYYFHSIDDMDLPNSVCLRLPRRTTFIGLVDVHEDITNIIHFEGTSTATWTCLSDRNKPYSELHGCKKYTRVYLMHKFTPYPLLRRI